MEREEQYLIHLLRAYLWQEEPENWKNVDWERLRKIAFDHNLAGILGYMCMTWPICPDSELQSRLRRRCLGTMMNCANRAALAEAFSRTLAENGIDHVLMKGYILRDYFPVPELRTFGDVDIVIRPEDRERSDILLQSLGYRRETDWEPVFSYGKESEYYEIHTEIMEVDVSARADYRGYFRGLWDHVIPIEAHRYQFAPEYHFLYMLVHIAKHVISSGAGLRMYLDVAAFLQRHGDALDIQYLSGELEKLALTKFSNTVLTLVRDWFGVESPLTLHKTDADILQTFAETTVNGGIFGQVNQNRGVNSMKKESAGAEISRTGTIVKRLFPAAQTIQSRYTYLQEKPWLLPAAWVHRLIKTKDRMQIHTAEARSILAADKDEVRKLTCLHRDIGL